MWTTRLHFCPIALVIIFSLAIFLSYGIAISINHILPVFSYISDAGTIPPEMNIFAQLLNIGCLFYISVVYIRFKQVELFYQLVYKKNNCTSNKVSCILGLVSVLGTSILANFQEKHTLPAHLFGAFLAFMGGGAWMCFQGFFSLKMLPHFGTKYLTYQRISIAVTEIIMYAGCQSTAIVSLSQFKGKDKLKWRMEDGGWIYRAISVTLEWLMICLFQLYILTFVEEFKKISFTWPHFIFLGVNLNPQAEEDAQVDQIVGGLYSREGLTCVHTKMKEDQEFNNEEGGGAITISTVHV